MQDSKSRFSNRVEDYKRYRPSYPLEALQFIKDKCKVDVNYKIADIGSGTGISTKALLDSFQCNVYAVEPNENMRLEAESVLSENPLFHSVKGSAETTTLNDQSINMVTAFQAFHWFDKEEIKGEFRRILKEPRYVVLVWNDRITKGSKFLEGYESILQEMPEYSKVNHTDIELQDIERFFNSSEMIYKEFPNSQKFDYEGLKGRFFSSSYTPSRGTPEYDQQIIKLHDLFKSTNVNGFIEFVYRTQVYIARFN